jgi:uncharacterized membrane protein
MTMGEGPGGGEPEPNGRAADTTRPGAVLAAAPDTDTATDTDTDTDTGSDTDTDLHVDPEPGAPPPGTADPVDEGDPGGPGARGNVAAAWRQLRTALGEQLAGVIPERPQSVILGLCVGVWFLVFSTLVVWRHDRYGSFDFDLGIWDQSAWLLAHNGGLNTVRGLHVLSHHFTPALYAYVPFYWLGAGANFLDVTMVLAVCAAVVVLYHIGRHHLRDDWHALIPALALMISFTAQWLLQETFHPEVMAVPFLLWAYLAAVKGRWRQYAAAVVLACFWKEDIALACVMIGVFFAFRGRRTVTGDEGPALTRRAGLITAAACFAYFVFATQFVIPHFSEGGNFTEVFFGDLGTTSPEIVKSILTRPDLVQEHLDKSDPANYFWNLAATFGFVSLLSPLALIIGLPQAAINMLANQNFFWPTTVHYATVPLVAMAIAAVEGVARFRRLPVRRFLLSLMAVGAFFTAVSWGVSPVSKDFRSGYWPLDESPNREALDWAVSLPAEDDAVSVMYNITPHLTHRTEAYTFPNPWIASNWAVNGENRPDPSSVDWIEVLPYALSEADRATLATVLRDPDQLLEPGKQGPAPAIDQLGDTADPTKWRILRADEQLFVAQRVRS